MRSCSTTSSVRGTSQQRVSSGRSGGHAGLRQAVVTRAASDRLLKKPALPPRPELPRPAEQPVASAQPAPAPAPAAEPSVASTSGSAGGVTIEWQRARAKEMRQYFVDRQQEAQAQKGQLFGWTPSNEIGNGRWVMFGVFVGLLTEYATGVDFPDQLKLMLSYLGIVDLE